MLYAALLHPMARRATDRGQLEVDSILVTFGLLFLAQGVFQLSFGSDFQGYAWLDRPGDILGASIAGGRVIGLVLSVVIGGGLYLAMTRTRWGVNLRAVASRPEFAALVGIDTRRQARMAFATGGALAAAGGAVLSMYQPFTSAEGGFLTMKALVIVIMGGVGDVRGTIVAALLLGVLETFVATLIDPGLTLAAAYLLFVLVLLFRPEGLFGRRSA